MCDVWKSRALTDRDKGLVTSHQWFQCWSFYPQTAPGWNTHAGHRCWSQRCPDKLCHSPVKSKEIHKYNIHVVCLSAAHISDTRGRLTLLIWSTVMTEEVESDLRSCRTILNVFSPFDSNTITIAWETQQKQSLNDGQSIKLCFCSPSLDLKYF